MIHIITRFWILFYSGAWTCEKGPPLFCLVLNSGLFQPEPAFRAGLWHSRWDSCSSLKSKLGLDCSSHCRNLLFTSTGKRNWWPERNRKPKYKNWWNLGQNTTWITRAVKQASVKRRLKREREMGREKDDIDLKQQFTCEAWPLEIELKLFFLLRKLLGSS